MVIPLNLSITNWLSLSLTHKLLMSVTMLVADVFVTVRFFTLLLKGTVYQAGFGLLMTYPVKWIDLGLYKRQACFYII
jgi:hypothetical protein